MDRSVAEVLQEILYGALFERVDLSSPFDDVLGKEAEEVRQLLAHLVRELREGHEEEPFTEEEVGHFFPELWPGRAEAIKILTERRNSRDKSALGWSAAESLYFPLVKGANAHLVQLFGVRRSSKTGVWFSPGGHSQTGTGRHCFATRGFCQAFITSFEHAVSAALKDSAIANPDFGIELWIEDPEGIDYAASVTGPSASLAIYSLVRSLIEGRRLSGPKWCLTGEISKDGSILAVEGHPKVRTVELCREHSIKDLHYGACMVDGHSIGTSPLDFPIVQETLASSFYINQFFMRQDKLKNFVRTVAKHFAEEKDPLLNAPAEAYDQVGIFLAEEYTDYRASKKEEEAGGDVKHLGAVPAISGRQHHEDDRAVSSRRRIPLRTSLLRRRFTLLRGTPGLGKSFALKRLYRLAAEEFERVPDRVPIHFQIPLLFTPANPFQLDPNANGSLESAIAWAALQPISHPHQPDRALEIEKYLTDAIGSGQAVLLADSIDEAPPGLRSTIFDRLRSLSHTNQVLIAGRKYGFPELPNRERLWLDLEPMEQREQRRVIETLPTEDSHKSSLASLVRNPLLKGTLEVPFLLAITALSLKRQPDLAKKDRLTPAPLMEAAFDSLWEGAAFRRPEEKRPDLDWRYLGEIVLRSYHDLLNPPNGARGSSRSLNVGRAIGLAKESEISSPEFARLLGVLAEAKIVAIVGGLPSNPNAEIVAGHRQIWEYLAGRTLGEHLIDDVSGRWCSYGASAAWHPDWEETVVFAADYAANSLKQKPLADSLIHKVMGDGWLSRADEVDKLDLLGVREALAARLLSRAPCPEKLEQVRLARLSELALGSYSQDTEFFSSSPRSILSTLSFPAGEESQRAKKLLDACLRLIKAEGDTSLSWRLAESLSGCWFALEPGEAKGLVERFLSVIKEEGGTGLSWRLAESLSGCWSALEPGEAKGFVDDFLSVIKKEGGTGFSWRFAQSLSGCWSALDEPDVAKGFVDAFLSVIKKEGDTDLSWRLAESLSGCWAALEPGEAKGLVERFLSVIKKEGGTGFSWRLAQSLSGCWSALDEPDVAKGFVDDFLSVIKEEGNTDLSWSLAESLSGCWSTLEPGEAKGFVDDFLSVIKEEGNTDLSQSLAQSLSGCWAALDEPGIKEIFERLLEGAEHLFRLICASAPYLASEHRKKLDEWLISQNPETWDLANSKYSSWGMLYQNEWRERGLYGLISTNLGRPVNEKGAATLNSLLLGPVGYVRGDEEIDITEETINAHQYYWCAHRFWRPLYAEGLRLFERNPPGKSRHGFKYVRTIEDLTGHLDYPGRA